MSKITGSCLCGSVKYSSDAEPLNDSSWLEPTLHIWCDTAEPWVEIAESMAKTPRNPPN